MLRCAFLLAARGGKRNQWNQARAQRKENETVPVLSGRGVPAKAPKTLPEDVVAHRRLESGVQAWRGAARVVHSVRAGTAELAAA